MLPVGCRGTGYGDGLFETLRFRSGRWCLWERHLARLIQGCGVLGLPWGDEAESLKAFLESEIASRFPVSADLLVKIMLIRDGGDGYRPLRSAGITEVATLKTYVGPAAETYRRGIDVRVLSWRLVGDDQLAHLKHLNRLPQVMASRELGDGEFEGLLLDRQDYVIEGTRSSLVLQLRDRWLTPDLRCAGVAGTMRAHLLQSAALAAGGLPLQVVGVRREDLEDVTAMAVCNSVFGIVPVARLEGRDLNVETVLRDWQQPVHEELNLPGG